MVKNIKIPKNKYVRIGLVLTCIMIFISTVILLFFVTNRALFSKNEHLILRHVKVASPGWWNGKSTKVSDILKLKLGESNLFEFKLNELRKKLEKEPSIAKVSMARFIPDTLQINITERIPRAFLSSKKSPWVADSTGIVMSRSSCLNLDKELPVILGVKKKNLTPGMELPELKPALDIFMLTKTDFPDLFITALSLKEPDQLIFILRYKSRYADPYTIQMPRTQLKFMLKLLKTAIIRSQQNRDSRRKINLLFDGNVIFSK